MDTNDFLGSYAQENVSFSVQTVVNTVSTSGDNYWKVMVFVEDTQFVDVSADGWALVAGSDTIRALEVTADDYATYTSGLLQSWLYDLYVSGFTGSTILVACGEATTTTTDEDSEETTTSYDSDTMVSNLETAYSLLKAYAYFKTVCVVSDTDSNAIDTAAATSLAELCAGDYGLLSSLPFYPYTTTTPADPTSDALYNAVVTEGGRNAFFAAHQDDSRNAALFALGIALATLNNSGTRVGNQFEMVATGNITCSGPDGTNLSKTVRETLSDLYIQTYKYVGDNTGNVAGYGAQYTNGDHVAAKWLSCYISYMVKVKVAQMMTTREFYKNATNYSRILNVLQSYLTLFESSGRLTSTLITAPGYDSLPEADMNTLIIYNAWQATYVDIVKNVEITGTLYIG